MQKIRYMSFCLVAAAAFSLLGCQPNPNQGFNVATVEGVSNASGQISGVAFPMVETLVNGQYVPSGNYLNPSGGVGQYSGYTSGDMSNRSTLGLYYVSNAIAPALWNNEVWFPSTCNDPITPGVYQVLTNPFTGQNEFEIDDVVMDNTGVSGPPQLTWECVVPASSLGSSSSRFALTGDIPSSVTLSGTTPFSSQYGMPVMYVFSGANGYPSFYSTITASSVDPSGATATFPLPASLPQNAYGFEMLTPNAAGTSTNNGINFFAAASSQTVSGNPFGVSIAAQTEKDYTCINLGSHGTKCTTTSSYTPVPVVSLYSAGQVLVGLGVDPWPVDVGINPTAVAAYLSGPTTTKSGVDTFTRSGATRAMVANSGSNTITIVDLVNRVPITTITVGNQPVALVASTNGAVGYVANYADSTVTPVDLSADTTSAAVAVGGKPTSVALTSAGILWVGGAGFLTEINTANMSVVANQSVSGKTIVALGYSDSVGELVATSVDTSGNVYADEINPSTVTTGAAYAPVASHSVSTVGTHLDTATGADVRAYTATLASTSTVNPNQAGAPPLVVQDGWAVVTATPTGFTITDITGHEVLVSETTPSPVTAIAADTNLNIVYLTMPDSNTILTVPLPGTN